MYQLGGISVQELLHNHEFELKQVLRAEMPADIFSKSTGEPTLSHMLNRMDLPVEDGRPDLAPHFAATIASVYVQRPRPCARRRRTMYDGSSSANWEIVLLTIVLVVACKTFLRTHTQK